MNNHIKRTPALWALIMLALMGLACSLTAIPAPSTTAGQTRASTARPALATQTGTAAPTQEPSPTPARCTVTAENLHLRSGPGASFPALEYLKAGALLHPTGQITGAWWKVTTPTGTAGWVNSKYINCTKG